MKKLIASKAFYKTVFVLVMPIIIQQGITNFVGLLDNIMVGALGTNELNSVAIVNQLIFVFNLTIFGGVSGVSIFGAQFFGKGDQEGMSYTLRIKLYFGVLCAGLMIALFLAYAPELIGLYLNAETNDPVALAATLAFALEYLKIALWGLVPFMVVQVYASTLRETGDTVTPMYASLWAIAINLVGNYLLIFGALGFPQMGVAGAALATVLSRWVEMLYVVYFAHRRAHKHPFFAQAFRSFRVPRALLLRVSIVATPLLVNEILWSLGTTFIYQNYAMRGLEVVAAVNITSTATQLFSVIMLAMGTAVSILVGQYLGAGEIERAKLVANQLLFVSVVVHVAIAVVFIVLSPLVPLLYNTETAVRTLTTELLVLAGLALPIQAFNHSAYFTIRAGGKTMITFFFDSFYTWVVPVPVSFFLCRYTGVSIVLCFAAVQFIEIIKIIISVPLLKSGFWANNITEPKNSV